MQLIICTGILPNGYNPPEGFCWDQSCDDPPIRDDPDLEDYNVDDVVQRFLAIARSQVGRVHCPAGVKTCNINVRDCVITNIPVMTKYILLNCAVSTMKIVWWSNNSKQNGAKNICLPTRQRAGASNNEWQQNRNRSEKMSIYHCQNCLKRQKTSISSVLVEPRSELKYLQPATRGRSRYFGFTFGDFLVI